MAELFVSPLPHCEHNALKLLRDGQVLVFESTDLRAVKNDDTLVYLKRTDNTILFLPVKSFEPDQYETFLAKFNQLFSGRS